MSGNTEATLNDRHCKCLLGWTGTAGAGSTLAMVENPSVVCDRTTRKSFAQGHDARFSSRLATEVANGETDESVAIQIIRAAGGTAALISKTTRSAKLRKEAATKKYQAKLARQHEARQNEDADESAETGAENTASDENTSPDEARVDPAETSDDSGSDEPPTPPELGTGWRVVHGKRKFNATVIELASTGERVANHKLGQGRDCYHDLATGEVIEVEADEPEEGDDPPF